MHPVLFLYLGKLLLLGISKICAARSIDDVMYIAEYNKEVLLKRASSQDGNGASSVPSPSSARPTTSGATDPANSPKRMNKPGRKVVVHTAEQLRDRRLRYNFKQRERNNRAREVELAKIAQKFPTKDAQEKEVDRLRLERLQHKAQLRKTFEDRLAVGQTKKRAKLANRLHSSETDNCLFRRVEKQREYFQRYIERKKQAKQSVQGPSKTPSTGSEKQQQQSKHGLDIDLNKFPPPE